MKFLSLALSVIINIPAFSQKSVPVKLPKSSPLATYSEEWNKPVYNTCNTAAAAAYMSDKEKEVIYILNLARSYPLLFANTVVSKYPFLSGQDNLASDVMYYKSLLTKLRSLNPAPLLYADKKCYTSAECHASSSGKTGYTGHIRTADDCKINRYYTGECCYYGNDDPLTIVLTLLIDKGVPTFGHRQILLGNFSQIGVSIKEHSTYGHNSVLDLH